jgi:hypothetical protein
VITHAQIKFAVVKIVQRKREKNRACSLNQKPPKWPEMALFVEIQVELERSPKVVVPELILETMLVAMVRERELLPFRCGNHSGFVVPSAVKQGREAAERNWGIGCS